MSKKRKKDQRLPDDTSSNIALKKQYGQHFLRDASIVNTMILAVDLNKNSSVFEIGCGDGFLTRAILKQDIERLWVFEIDPEWSCYIEENISDSRLTVYNQNFLDIDFSQFDKHKPWVLLANLPYVVTFPILYKLQQHRDVLQEGVVMVQEEVAQKIVATSGRNYGYVSLFLQHYFDWKLLTKIKPDAFYPPPKVDSRLLYLKPKKDLDYISDDPKEREEFWKFIKRSFQKPRKMLRNNLKSYDYDLSEVSEDTLNLRAQQMTKQDFLDLWSIIKKK